MSVFTAGFEAKLADFGLSDLSSPTNKLTARSGTPVWMAPELWLLESEKVQIHSTFKNECFTRDIEK